MPPRSDKIYGDTSVTGLSDKILEAARNLARQKKIYPRDVYTEAILDMILRMDSGETIEWPKIPPGLGYRPYHIRLEEEVIEQMRDACKRHEVKINFFFLAALRDHLIANGVEIDA
jgi:hypothetical protein